MLDPAVSNAGPNKSHIDGIDHAMVIVRDLDAAARQYQSLGFNLTPRGRHTHTKTENHLAMLNGTYIELLAVPHANEANEYLKKQSDIAEGLWQLALRSSDTESDYNYLTSHGIEARKP